MIGHWRHLLFDSVREYWSHHKNQMTYFLEESNCEELSHSTLSRNTVKDLLFCHSLKTDLTRITQLFVSCCKTPLNSSQTKEPVNSNKQTKAKQRGFIWRGLGAFREWIREMLGCCAAQMTQVVSDRPWGDLQAELPGSVCDTDSRNGTLAILRFTPLPGDNLIQLKMWNKT